MGRRDKVAVLGFTTHNKYAPWADESYELWGLNDLHGMVEAFAPGVFKTDRMRWFQMHRDDGAGFHGVRDPNHRDWLKAAAGFPVYMWAAHPEIPASVAYPLKDILTKAVLPHGKPISEEAYYNNSISWMIALAILEGFKEIAIFGVDMALEGVHGQSEYGHQRPSVEYFVGVARGLGIDVQLHPESEICKCAYLYGFDNVSYFRRKLQARIEHLEQQDADTSNDYEAIKRGLHETRGALWAIGQLAPDHPKIAELQQRELGLINEYEAAKRAIHEIRGAKNDVTWQLRNYFPGEGAYQDVERWPRSNIRPDEIQDLTAYAVLPPQSDGQSPVNRIKAALTAPKVEITLDRLPIPEAPHA